MPDTATEKEIIHREFEMERVILFSDAVFAIAITLLIIDVQFPDIPKDVKNLNYWLVFKPTILSFTALCISFFFIGNFWMKHLSLFKYFKSYDKGLIIHNLLFLFFIILFPFTAQAIATHMAPHFLLPLFIYIINISCCAVMHALLCRYMFVRKKHLSVPGFNEQKNYLYKASKYLAVCISSVSIITLVLYFAFPNDPSYILYSFDIFAVIMIIMMRKIRKQKPKIEF